MRYAADVTKALGSTIALIGIPILAWLGFVALIEVVALLLDLL